MEIYISRGGNQIGPFDEDQIRGMRSAGLITGDDLAQQKGATEWLTLESLLQSVQRPPQTEIIYPAQTVPAAKARPNGIGGWLLLFCMSLTLFSPLLSLGQMSNAWRASSPAFGSFPAFKDALIWENFCTTILGIYGIIVGCKIWSGNPRGRDLAQRYLNVSLVTYFGTEAITLALMTSLPSELLSEAIDGFFKGGIGQFVRFTIWWLYFKKSKRVRNTYGEP